MPGPAHKKSWDYTVPVSYGEATPWGLAWGSKWDRALPEVLRKNIKASFRAWPYQQSEKEYYISYHWYGTINPYSHDGAYKINKLCMALLVKLTNSGCWNVGDTWIATMPKILTAWTEYSKLKLCSNTQQERKTKSAWRHSTQQERIPIPHH